MREPELGWWEVALVAGTARQDVVPVLGVLVCHDGDELLPDVLDAVTRSSVRPRHLVVVSIGGDESQGEQRWPPQRIVRARTENSAEESADSDTGERDVVAGHDIVDMVVLLPADIGFGEAVNDAVARATERWGDPGRWVWLLHDDAAPEPDCLANLLHQAEFDSTAAVLGPLGLDWSDPRLVVDAGLSLDSSGGRQTGIEPSELDPALGVSGELSVSEVLPVSEVLAVSTACALLRREVFDAVGGFDAAARDAGADLDLGWRINAAGHLVLCVPNARMRHVSARGGCGWSRGEQRVRGVRTFLVNTTGIAFLLGVPRILLRSIVRALGFALARRGADAAAELSVLTSLVTGRLALLRGRRERRARTPRPASVRGLLISRRARLRNAARAAFARVVRGRVRRDLAIGQLPTDELRAVPPPTRRRIGPDALPAGALPPPDARRRGVGLRRPSDPVVVAVESVPADEDTAARPSPTPRDGGAAEPDFVLVPMNRRRALRELLLTPPVILVAALTALAVLTHWVLPDSPRWGSLAGGALLPAADLGATWADYLAAWHPVGGGTAAPAPAALLVLGLLGIPLAPIGGPAAVLTVVLVGAMPLAGCSAYLASAALPVSRRWRAVVAAAYAVVPAASVSAAHGRVDVIVTQLLLPVVLAGLASVLGLTRLSRLPAGSRHWFSSACLTALGVAVLGAFAPLAQLLVIVLALVGSVWVPAPARRTPHRGVALSVVVLLPVACLLPWPVALFERPELLVHGLGASSADTGAGAELLALSPGGGALAWCGVLIVLAGLAALTAKPGRAAIPALVLIGFGALTAVLVGFVPMTSVDGRSSAGWAGIPLLFVVAGLCWLMLLAARAGWRGRWTLAPRLAAGLAGGGLFVLGAAAAFTASAGPLRPAQMAPAPVSAEAETARLVLGQGASPTRLTTGDGPHFGEDALAPTPSGTRWLTGVTDDLTSAEPERVRAAVASLAARGIGRIDAPPALAHPLPALSGGLLIADGPGETGLRVTLPAHPVSLLGPDLARQARGEDAPRPQARPVPVPGRLPHVAVRVSEGGPGRVLLLGAENEPGWRAEIDGRDAPLATAWGHQVAVPVPEHASEVRVSYTELPRTTLLVLQAGAILFTLIGALPARRRLRGGQR